VSHRRKRDLTRIAEDLGFLVTKTRRGHLRCRHPNGRQVIVAAFNVDHPAVWRNALTNLRRASRQTGRLA
jgi:hypothetical protein